MRLSLRFLPFLSALLLLITGCSGIEPSTTTGSLIVGVTSDLRAGVDVLRLHVIQRVDGQTIRDEELFSDGAHPFAFPLELPFTDLEDGASVEVSIEAFGSLSQPLLTRLARSSILRGRSLLMRVDLAAACAGPSAPTCAEDQSCTGGVCASAERSPLLLEAYTPEWAKRTDICKSGVGEPIVIVGKGQGDFLPMEDGDVAQIEAGPQGGHHIWVAVRTQNLRRSGTITTLDGYVPELDLNLQPFSVIFTFDPDDGDFCKLYGLRFQLDVNNSIQELLGKKLRVTATLTDKDGDVGKGERVVTLSPSIL